MEYNISEKVLGDAVEVLREHLREHEGYCLRIGSRRFECQSYVLNIFWRRLCDGPNSFSGPSTSTINFLYKPTNTCLIVHRNGSSLELVQEFECLEYNKKSIKSIIRSVLEEISEEVQDVLQSSGVIMNTGDGLWKAVTAGGNPLEMIIPSMMKPGSSMEYVLTHEPSIGGHSDSDRNSPVL